VKRQDQLIEAAVIARRRVPELRVVIVGEGPMRAELEAAVERHEAREWITLAGRLDRAELVALYQRAWLVTSASLAEGWGLTLTEAAACGTAAVATDISGHRSSVVDGVTGVLAPLERLGDTIADVLLDHARREQLAAAALQRARTLTWDRVAVGVLDALHSRVVAR
jgi:glycosyltransferase involved in cell wall biosynthesis